MCDHCGLYNYFPSVVIGGVAGDYFVDCPVISCKYAEYKVLSIANSTLADAQIVVSGDSKPSALSYVAASSQLLSDNAFFRGQAFFVTFEHGYNTPMEWQRITHSSKRVFMSLANGAGVTYVTIQFRVRLIDIIPGPSDAIHPDLGHQMNIQRSDRIEQKLKKSERIIENANKKIL